MALFRVFSPSKINLVLAVTGLRTDGFHDLVSLVAPLDWGDEIEVYTPNRASADTLDCDFPGVPTDASNLILKAAAAFRARLPRENQPPFTHFLLRKKTPAGAGLGGGSGNAAAALHALSRLCKQPYPDDFLEEIAASVGSDCPLFIKGRPVLMRGRGEVLEPISVNAAQKITGRRVCLFKPSFGINTGWAYGRMKAAAPLYYEQSRQGIDLLDHWLESPTDQLPLFNNMQGVAFEKYVALPALLERVRAQFDIPCLMSGSGSACFALPREETDLTALRRCVEDAWGKDAWIAECRLR